MDETPQFFNVLKGDMSLVGTRPPTVDEWEKYGSRHRLRLAIKPGITGLWQVSGRSAITDFEEVLKLDTDYIYNWSLGLDIKVLDKYDEEIDLKQTFDDDDDIGLGMPVVPENEGESFENDIVADSFDGFGLEDENGDAISEENYELDGMDADEDEEI